MRMGQGVRTGLGHGVSPVSYRHNCLVFLFVFCFVCFSALPGMASQMHNKSTNIGL